jgi:hypothetical protein
MDRRPDGNTRSNPLDLCVAQREKSYAAAASARQIACIRAVELAKEFYGSPSDTPGDNPAIVQASITAQYIARCGLSAADAAFAASMKAADIAFLSCTQQQGRHKIPDPIDSNGGVGAV